MASSSMNVRQAAAEAQAEAGSAAAPAVGPSRARQSGGQALRLRGRPLAVARVVCVVVAIVSWYMFAVAVPVRYSQLANAPAALRNALGQLGLSVEFYALYTLGLEILFALASSVIALVIFLRRSDEVMALYASLLNVVFGIAAVPLTNTLNALVQSQPAWFFPFRFLTYLAWLGAITSFFLFPDGRFVPRWTRFVALLFA